MAGAGSRTGRWEGTTGMGGADGTHSDTCTKMSSDPFSGVMKPWPCERENCLQTPLNTGPAEARAVLRRIGKGDWSRSLGPPHSPGPRLRRLPRGCGEGSPGQKPHSGASSVLSSPHLTDEQTAAQRGGERLSQGAQRTGLLTPSQPPLSAQSPPLLTTSRST